MSCCAAFDAAEPQLIRELARTRPAPPLRGPAHGPDAARLHSLCRGSRSPALAHRRPLAQDLRNELFACAASMHKPGRGRGAQSRHHGRAARRLGPAARAVPPDPQGPRQRLRAGARRQAVRSRAVSLPRRPRRARPIRRASLGRLRRLRAAHARRADDPASAGRRRASASPTARSTSSRSARSTRPSWASRSRPPPGRSLAIKAGKNNRTPVFVDLEKLAAAKGKDRIKYLKEEADRGQLSASVAKAVEAAKTAAELAAALDPIVDERGSPKKHEIAAGTPILQPTDERRRTGSHYTPRSSPRRSCDHALEPAFERLGPERDAGADSRSQGLRSGHGLGRLPGRGLPRARRAAGRGVGALAGEEADHSRRTRTRSCTPPPGRAALPLRRRQEPARHRSRQAVAVARDARARPRVHLPRSRAEIGRQPGGARRRRRSRRRIGTRRSPACRCSANW